MEHYGGHRDFDIESKKLLHRSDNSTKLIDQVIALERQIGRRLNLRPCKVGDKITLEFGYKRADGSDPLKGLKLKNIGFGNSYLLAIAVALLSSEPYSLVIIENPKTHLHPKGQSKLAELICLDPESDIQVIVETHSDHISNGVRRAVKSNLIKNEHTKIHFFETDEHNTTVFTPILLSEKGRVLLVAKSI